jgi:hypothetical protein
MTLHGRIEAGAMSLLSKKVTRRSFLTIAAAALVGASALPGEAASPPHMEPNVSADRWMEIDLYWFDLKDIPGSVAKFWDRFLPLYEGISGCRGTLLNVGWTVGAVMEWSGSLNQAISLPKGTGQAKWVVEKGQLTGTTQQRQQEEDTRFAGAVNVPRQPYDPWTYGDLKTVTSALREEGARRGIAGFKVGMFNLAWQNAYGEGPPWVQRHPEAFSGAFDPSHLLHADPGPYGGFPNGIPEGTVASQAYAAQWGSLSKTVGLDAIMLRDSFGFPSAYSRSADAYSADFIKNVTASNVALIREVKLANPQALVMMYSSGASAVADWRCDGTDLEAIANDGYLDIFVDQTWAGAWNEVGLRQGGFWNNPALGWTYQLTNMLVHSAILAKSKVRHYPLVETFDAWEDWDIIHTAPERLRWGMWAYSHAAVKTPTGLKFPAGTYISWANQGKRLLSDDDVHFLAGNLNAAIADARQTDEVYGPTIVYARSAMQWQAENAAPNQDVNEWVDEQVGSLIKWPLPVLSITRIEWLSQVKSDLFLLQTPAHITSAEVAVVKGLIANGQPVAIFGAKAAGIDPSLAALYADYQTDLVPSTTGQRVGANLVIWDPPAFHYGGGPLKQLWIGAGPAYVETTTTLNTLLGQNGKLHAAVIDWYQTTNVSAWHNRDGTIRIMAANLEEGLREDADFSRHNVLLIPSSWHAVKWRDQWNGAAITNAVGGKLKLDLPQAASVMLVSQRPAGPLSRR